MSLGFIALAEDYFLPPRESALSIQWVSPEWAPMMEIEPLNFTEEFPDDRIPKTRSDLG